MSKSTMAGYEFGALRQSLEVAVTGAVLVTGGTGRIGRVLVPRLLFDGHEVRVLSREERPAESSHRWVAGDLRSGRGLDEAVDGVGTILHCATTNGKADVDCARRLVGAARRAGQPHLIYLSIVGIDQVPLPYYRAKWEAERLVQESGLPWTVLRATQFHDLLVSLCSVQRWSPTILMPAGVSFQPIDVGEVADRLTELAGDAPAGRVADLGGPEIRAAVDLARAYLRANGRRRLVTPVRLPGAAFRAYRDGRHLAPEQATGQVTFDEFLASADGRSSPL